MINSIQHFEEIGIRKLEKVIENFLKNPKDMASFVTGIEKEIISLGLGIIQETLENCDTMIRDSGKRKQDWTISRKDKKQLITSLGEVTFQKTLFRNRRDGHSEYLLDTIMGMESHERLTEDAEAKLLEEAVDTSYQKAGNRTSISTSVSKQTVKNKIHELEFPEKSPIKTRKQKVDFLYIDADEDHVALQFQNRKGDLGKNEWNRKNNCLMTKLVYVYEGIEKENPKSRRHRLVNPHYFSGTYNGEEGNSRLWEAVYAYVEQSYDLDHVKKIFLNGDGGSWIKAGKKKIAGITYVLDEFHIKQCLVRATSHLLGNAQEAREELLKTMKTGTKKELQEIFVQIQNITETAAGKKRVKASEEYILGNWTSIKVRMNCRNQVRGCSAEGHVSHVLSARMSSRPLGWSRTGADKMAHLRAYKWNGGDMLALVRYQRREKLPMAVGAEYDVISATEMLHAERKNYTELGKYVSSINHHLPGDTKKYAWFRSHIWNL